MAGSSDPWTTFGAEGAGATVPTASIPYAQPTTVAALSLVPSDGAVVPPALTEDVLAELAGLPAKQKKA